MSEKYLSILYVSCTSVIQMIQNYSRIAVYIEMCFHYNGPSNILVTSIQ